MTEARRLVRKMRGGSQAHLIEGDDGNCYVVKFTNNLQHRRVLINEWVAAQLMRRVGIATPVAVLINVSREFLAGNGDVYICSKKSRIDVEAGIHFGSRYPGHPDTTAIHDILPDSFFDRIGNRDDFIGAMVFDRWVCNTDKPQAIFAPSREETETSREGQFEALMIDRGFAFGGTEWLLRDSPLAGIYPQTAFYDGLRGIGDCEPWLSRIEAIKPDFLEQVVDSVPQTWRSSSDSALERMLQELVARRYRTADSIIASANSADRPFRNWASGS